jgi:MoaA/NifB/PqqE/SkfB family radical SAM enzyme
MITDIKGFHVELTNICTLKCPRCPRTGFLETFPKRWKNHNLNLDDFKNFFDISLDGVTFELCGNYGDPIYYPDIFEFIDWTKNKGATVKLVTNGSYKTVDWWTELIARLDSTDSVCFSIDGIPENFTNYRKNADWESISVGLQVVGSSNVKSFWKYIPFSFNENDIPKAQELADSYGIKEFVVTPSDRWIPNDPLKPLTFAPTNNTIKNVDDLEISPICKNDNDRHYISASGHYSPCCFTSLHMYTYKNEFGKNKKEYDISKTTITNILNRDTVVNFYNTIETTKPSVCSFNCPKK